MNADLISRPQLILHGGVIDDVDADYSWPGSVLESVCRDGYDRLRAGEAALDVVEEAVDRLERSGAFVAGKGSSPNRAGDYELDGSIMEGATARGGAVAAVKNAVGAVRLARLVMDETDHVLLAGDGVKAAFGDHRELFLDDPAAYFTPVVPRRRAASDEPDHGTVGAAALDLSGRFAAATATGGLRNKRPGRVGDPAILGAGTWADKNVAVSCTGEGEYFIRTAAAASVAFRMRFAGTDADAAAAAIADIGDLGGHGGIIAAHRGGVSVAFNTRGIQIAWVDERGECHAGVRRA